MNPNGKSGEKTVGEKADELFDWLELQFKYPDRECLSKVIKHCSERDWHALNAAVAELSKYYNVASPRVITPEEGYRLGVPSVNLVESGAFDAVYGPKEEVIVLGPKVLRQGYLYHVIKTILHEFYHHLTYVEAPGDVKEVFREGPMLLRGSILALSESFAEGKAWGTMPLVEQEATEKRISLYPAHLKHMWK